MEWRNEYKYVLTDAQIAVLRARLDALMSVDPHQSGPFYEIRSLYFDDLTDSALAENEAGTDRREKFRIRYYGNGFDRLRLEIKSRQSGKTKKESCPLDRETAEAIRRGEPPLPGPQYHPVLNRLLLKMHTELLAPRLIVDYERSAWVLEEGNVRITFDRNICCSEELDGFWTNGYEKLPVLEPGRHMLEVKYDELLPDYVTRALEPEGLTWCAFSKYYLGRLAAGEGVTL